MQTMTIDDITETNDEGKQTAPLNNSTLQPGRYWVTFPLGGKHYKRRVVVEPDPVGVLRCRWANPEWQVFPPLSPDDIGLRVDQMDESIRFEPYVAPVATVGSANVAAESAVANDLDADTDVITDEQSQAPRRALVDCDGDPLKCGRYYLQSASGKLDAVKITEDQLTFDLWIERDGKRQRVDELPESAVLIPHDCSWTD